MYNNFLEKSFHYLGSQVENLVKTLKANDNNNNSDDDVEEEVTTTNNNNKKRRYNNDFLKLSFS